MNMQVFCQDCRSYKPMAYNVPRCPNPDGIVWVRVANNCSSFVAKMVKTG